MNAGRRLAYLEALGVDVYVQRPTVAAPTVAAAVPDVPSAVVQGPEAALDWDALRATVSACTRCALNATRTQTVFGVGNPRARWMFIGEAPGAEEDRQGEPFVGRAGQLLNSILLAAGFTRRQVYIANILSLLSALGALLISWTIAFAQGPFAYITIRGPYLNGEVTSAAPALIEAFDTFADFSKISA